MRKPTDGQLAIGALIAFALWIFVALPLYYSSRDASAYNCSAQENKDYGFWEKTRCDPVAYFTIWLVGFTGVLAASTIGLWIVTWRSGVRQSNDMKDSVEVARRAATAAELAAQASIGVQLPRLAARFMKLFEPSQPHGGYRPFDTPIVSGDPRDWSQVSVQIFNIGKTTAIVTAECIDYFVGPRLPKVPKYTMVLPSPVDNVIEADGSMDLQITNYFIHLTAEQRNAMKTIELSHRLWVYGFIRYTDFLDKPHEYRFCRRCIWSGGIVGTGIAFVSESDTPVEYTRSY